MRLGDVAGGDWLVGVGGLRIPCFSLPFFQPLSRVSHPKTLLEEHYSHHHHNNNNKMEKSKHLPKGADERTATLNDQSLSENEVRRRLATYIPQKGSHDSKFIFGENNAKNHIEKGSIDKKTTIFISNCEGGEVIIDAMCTKVMIQGCKGIKVVCNGVVLTNSVEVWACDDVVLEVNEILVATLQVDLCKNFKVSFSRRKLFHKLIWAAVDGYSITFKDIEKQLLEKEKEEEKEGEKIVKAVFTNSYDEMVKRYPQEEFQKNIAQFIDSLEENGEVRYAFFFFFFLIFFFFFSSLFVSLSFLSPFLFQLLTSPPPPPPQI